MKRITAKTRQASKPYRCVDKRNYINSNTIYILGMIEDVLEENGFGKYDEDINGTGITYIKELREFFNKNVSATNESTDNDVVDAVAYGVIEGLSVEEHIELADAVMESDDNIIIDDTFVENEINISFDDTVAINEEMTVDNETIDIPNKEEAVVEEAVVEEAPKPKRGRKKKTVVEETPIVSEESLSSEKVETPMLTENDNTVNTDVVETPTEEESVSSDEEYNLFS